MGNTRVVGIPAFMDAKNLQPLISKDLQDMIEKIEYLDKNNKNQSGYNANILPLVSDLYLKARERGVIKKENQLQTAYKAEILVRSLAKIGIIALVDEATGYQYKRDRDDLQVILSAYITDEVAKCQLTFTEDFYYQIFKLWKQPYNKTKRPAFFGTLTNKYIYEPIQNGYILNTVKKMADNDDNKSRFHQYLTQDIGREHLKRQIVEITVLMSICNTKEDFIEIFENKYNKNHQLSLFDGSPNVNKNKKPSL
jgi:hypothetical protein